MSKLCIWKTNFGFKSLGDLGYYKHWKKKKVITVKIVNSWFALRDFLTEFFSIEGSDQVQIDWFEVVNQYFLSVRQPLGRFFSSAKLPVWPHYWWRPGTVHRECLLHEVVLCLKHLLSSLCCIILKKKEDYLCLIFALGELFMWILDFSE